MNPELYHGDCLEVMAGLPDASVDMILCDLPYGTTACKWDTAIPFEPLWAQYRRIAKRNAAIVLTASQPFTTALIASNYRDFRYCWVWEKSTGTGFLDANRRPLRCHEDVAVFYRGSPAYTPQKWQGAPNHGNKTAVRKTKSIHAGEYGRPAPDLSGMKFPRSVVKFDKSSSSERLHPTQKPVALMEYLIRTYTQEGETVLDNCMGSGTTGVACANTGRRFIGIERDDKYFQAAKDRIEARLREAA